MLSEADLTAAVDEGIVSADQADALRRFSRERSQDVAAPPHVSPDEEGFRSLTGFADVFLAIGAVVLLSGLRGVGLEQTAAGLAVCLAASWLLTEIFATWQRRTLPSMVCALFFVYFATALAVDRLYGFALADLLEPPGPVVLMAGHYERLPLMALIAGLVFYLRFRLPFSLFIVALSFALAVVAFMIRSQGLADASSILIPVLFVTGLTIFSGVVYFDARDRLRRTRLSDNAFWLSLVASPLIVHSIMWQAAIWLAGDEITRLGQLRQIGDSLSVAVIAIFLVLMVVALVVDRRAILFSTLIYVTAVVAYLFSRGGSAADAVGIVPIVMGAGMIAVGSFWQGLRRLVFSVLPLGRIEPFLAPVRA